MNLAIVLEFKENERDIINIATEYNTTYNENNTWPPPDEKDIY